MSKPSTSALSDETRTSATGDKSTGTKETSLIDILSMTEDSVASLKSALKHFDGSIYKEFRAIAEQINQTKTEISKLGINGLQPDRIPEAGRELQAVVDATEEATNQIMECAETIMTADPSSPATYHNIINDNIMMIFEACSFQDITGQRISKVVETLSYIDKRVNQFADTLESRDPSLENRHFDEEEARAAERKRDLLLNGPQLDDVGVSQDDIDQLFA